MKWIFLCALTLAPLKAINLKAQDLKGHAAPIRALTMKTPNSLISGSFDQNVIEWDLTNNIATKIYKKHEGAVNAIIYSVQIISAGDDGTLIFWGENKTEKRHDSAISSLAYNNGTIAASSWDNRVSLGTRYYTQHQAPVSAVKFYDDKTLISIDHKAELHHWNKESLELITKVKLATPAHSLYVTTQKHIILGQANGELLISQPKNFTFTTHTLSASPIIALAMNEDETLLAAAALGGTVTLFDMKASKKLFSLEGAGLPVWSVLFNHDEIITGGQDGQIRRWDSITGEHKGAVIEKPTLNPLEEHKGERGAEVFRACAFCHSLKEGEERAGPTLHNIINRKAGTIKGYSYSQVIIEKNIFWTKNNLHALFTVGPNAYIAGSKMPEQIITNKQDLTDLIEYIEKKSQN